MTSSNILRLQVELEKSYLGLRRFPKESDFFANRQDSSYAMLYQPKSEAKRRKHQSSKKLARTKGFDKIIGPLTSLLSFTPTKAIKYLLILVDAAKKDRVDGRNKMIIILSKSSQCFIQASARLPSYSPLS